MTAALAEEVRRRLLDEPPGPVTPARVRRLARAAAPLLHETDLEPLVARVCAVTSGLGRLDELLADDAVSEVMVNGPGPVWVERSGVVERAPLVLDAGAIEHAIEKVVAPLGLRVDRSSPLVDARLPDGSRVNAVVPPLAVDGPCLTIRRFRRRAVGLADFAAPPVVALLERAVAEGRNLIVSGGTASGKTTLLNALAGTIPAAERVITVEDAAELSLARDHVVRLEARPPNAEGAGGATVRDLVRNALRMRPDRIVVGEVRDGAAFDMLQAMNTGHDGSLSTCHANGPVDAIRRLETMTLMAGVPLPLVAVRQQIASAVDVVVHVARTGRARRVVTEVTEVAEATGDRRARADLPPRLRPLVSDGRVVGEPTRPRRRPA